MSKSYNGLNFIETLQDNNLHRDSDIDTYMKLFVLLYADDTIVMAESVHELQLAMNSMYEYCVVNKLAINTSKTKVMVFSRGKIRNKPEIMYGDTKLQVVDEYVYLGITFNYNGNFVKANKRLCQVASNAMFAVLKKGRTLQLDIDTQVHLFHSVVVPIVLYGCEVWGYSNLNMIEKLQLRFCKILLSVKKSTPNVMIYGELGMFPLQLTIKTRMISFWIKLLHGNHLKLSRLLYNLIDKDNSSWLRYIYNTLNECGMSFIWMTQANNVNTNWLKLTLSQNLKDQFCQQWQDQVNNSSKCLNYHIFKTTINFENYLITLPKRWRIIFTKFRCRSHRLPIEQGIFDGKIREERFCTICSSNEIGDEFHYIFKCKSLSEERKQFIPLKYYSNPSNINMCKLFNSRNEVLYKLCRFILIVLRKMS